ncbi:thiol:disulfide interchange protein DsbD [Neoasaia chiangmaiensis]|uniref:protein-disulfide reductase DsbD family protein n=1 Tax=Neoasaia chiangmaiensis TaxID=320497 RepID=UPI00118F638E|nr:thioredoxin family protein [Neoasaia chiangmaiensis]GEN14211.1 thiol:disulfide interchange protein DsbD [Neoasaia chiangmaiensis]
MGNMSLRGFLTGALAALTLCPLAWGGTAHAAESTPVTSDHDVATLVSDRDAIGPGQVLHVGLHLKLKPGWHTYWLNPGDAGEAPTLKVTADGRGQSERIDWPTPVRISEGGLMSYAYTGDVLLPEALTLHGNGGATLKAHAEWLVCASTCVPESGDFTLALPAAPNDPGVGKDGAIFARAAAARPMPSPFAASIAADGTLSLTGQGLSPQSVERAWFMPATTGVIDQVAPQKFEVTDGRLALHLKWMQGVKHDGDMSGIVVLQDAADQSSSLWIDARPGAGAAASTPVHAATAAPVAAPIAAPATSLPRMLLFAFLGGLILNLMPCVFPVLAMKALSVAKMGGAGRQVALRSALAYSGGVMGTFALLGGLMLVLRAAGSAAGWGFQFQSPVFVVAVCWLLFAMALNLLGVFEITTGGIGQDIVPKSGLGGDVLTGLLAVVVATPCTAPFMGAAIAAALGGPAWAGIAIFLAMGLGLAAPYLLIAGVPGVASRLPRPGAWMSVMKQFLAFPLLATCVWLLWVAGLQRGADVVAMATGGAVALGFAAWLFGMAQRRAMIDGPTRGVVFSRVLAVVTVALAFVVLSRVATGPADAVAPPATQATTAQAGIVPFSTARLDAARAQGKPVFIDMTAAWCITCMVNERVALDTGAVQSAFRDRGVVYMKGDWTNRNEAIGAYLRAHGRDGVPLYVYYPPHGDGQVLPQILSPGLVLATLQGKAG